MLPLPKQRKLPPSVIRKKKREQILSEYSLGSSALRSNFSKYEHYSPKHRPLSKKMGAISSSSEKGNHAKGDIKISNLNTFVEPQFGSVSLKKNYSDMNAVRKMEQSKNALDISN
mmetsp:Transcript_28289/g.42843  ORF Transcript_28289/g.42843 Transcript_28289/m.42843 type:complete len:115 (+) Transcript_28289:72-416(+)